MQTENEAALANMPVPKAIAKFAIPTVLSQLIHVIYSLADTFFVGHTGDEMQISALTLTFPIFMMITCVGNLFGIGANSYMSRALGRGEREEARKSSVIALYAAMAVSLLLSVAAGVWMEPLLYFVGASDGNLPHAAEYLKWTIVLGMLPSVASLVIGHELRAVGETGKASRGMIGGGLANIVLDYLLIFPCGMGVAGAGLATAASNCGVLVYYIIEIIRMKKGDTIELRIHKLVPRRDILREIVLVGLPSAIQIILGSSSNIIMTRLLHGYGEVAMAAYGVSQKIASIGVQITIGLTHGIMPLVGYSYGAGNMARVREISRVSFAVLACAVVLGLAGVLCFPRAITDAFVTNAATATLAAEFLKIHIFCLPGNSYVNLFGALFQAMGKWKRALALQCIRIGGLMIPLLLLFSLFGSMYALIAAAPAADTLSLCLAAGMYFMLLRERKQERKA